MEAYCYNAAAKIYNHYHALAKKEFDEPTSNFLAKIPADYVFNQLMDTYPNCFVNERCCLEHCNDMLDEEFKTMSPEFKRELYNRSKSVQTTVSDHEINMFLSGKRRHFKNMFYNAVRENKQQQENDISVRLQNVSLKRKNTDNTGVIDNALKNLRLN